GGAFVRVGSRAGPRAVGHARAPRRLRRRPVVVANGLRRRRPHHLRPTPPLHSRLPTRPHPKWPQRPNPRPRIRPAPVKESTGRRGGSRVFCWFEPLGIERRLRSRRSMPNGSKPKNSRLADLPASPPPCYLALAL